MGQGPYQLDDMTISSVLIMIRSSLNVRTMVPFLMDVEHHREELFHVKKQINVSCRSTVGIQE